MRTKSSAEVKLYMDRFERIYNASAVAAPATVQDPHHDADDEGATVATAAAAAADDDDHRRRCVLDLVNASRSHTTINVVAGNTNTPRHTLTAYSYV